MHGHTASIPALGAATLWTVFALGLTGGFGHCLMMCGPFVGGASLGAGASGAGARAATRFQAAYHAGRLATYTGIGLVLGMLGEAGALSTLSGPFSPTAISRWLKLGVGAITVALGVWVLVRWVLRRSARLPEPAALLLNSRRFSQAASALMRREGSLGFPLGMLMGLLPCGPLLPVELAALASGLPLYGATIMLAFGLGTVPALAGFGAASALVGSRARGWLTPASGIVVIALGGLTVAQGLSLIAA